jgi:hypothetical protein
MGGLIPPGKMFHPPSRRTEQEEDRGAGGPPLVMATECNVPCARRSTSDDEPAASCLRRLPSKSTWTAAHSWPISLLQLAPELQIRPPSTNGRHSAAAMAKQQSNAAKPRRSPRSSSLTATAGWSMAAAPSSRQHAFHSAHRIGTKGNKAAPPPPRVLRSTRQPAEQQQATFTFPTAFSQRLVITPDGSKVERPWPVIFPRNHHLGPFCSRFTAAESERPFWPTSPSPRLVFAAEKVKSRDVGQPENNGRPLLVSCCLSGTARRGREGGKY